jgi:hypothetical protein
MESISAGVVIIPRDNDGGVLNVTSEIAAKEQVVEYGYWNRVNDIFYGTTMQDIMQDDDVDRSVFPVDVDCKVPSKQLKTKAFVGLI